MPPQERQMALHIDDICQGHVARYRFAADNLMRGAVIDAACGIGYGTKILADNSVGFAVYGFDRCEETIDMADKHYAHESASYHVVDLDKKPQDVIAALKKHANTLVCLETLEHLAAPLEFLRVAGPMRLIASVPNELVFPWHPKLFCHHRHYTPQQFKDLLEKAGYGAFQYWYTQKSKSSAEIQPVRFADDAFGRYIIVVAQRGESVTTWSGLS